MPRVSVIIPTYNRAHFVCEAIESVLRQSFRDFEIIVVDDGSTDDTREAVARFGGQIQYVYQEHRGSCEARNTALRIATGEMIAFLDSDDAWHPGKLEKQLPLLDSDESIGLVYTFTEIIGEQGQLLPCESRERLKLHKKAARCGYSYEAMSKQCILWPSTILVRRKYLDLVGFFDSKTEAFEDWDLYLRLSLECRFVGIPEPLVQFRFHGKRRANREFAEGRINTALKHIALLKKSPDLSFSKRAEANFFLHLAATYYMTTEISWCRKYIWEAFKLRPFSVFDFQTSKRFLMSFLRPALNKTLCRNSNLIHSVTLRRPDGRVGGNGQFDERIVPDKTEKGIVSIHLKRYVFASEFCRSKCVLDAACGVGYGVDYLSAFAEQVIGIDRTQEAIDLARRRYQRANTVFFKMDACALSFRDEVFDVVCSFETIEHIENVEAYLGRIVRVLKGEGVYLVSTPCVSETTSTPKNPFHYQEWSPDDFKQLLRTYFSSVALFGQRRRQTTLHRILQKTDPFRLRARIHIAWLKKSLKTLSYAVGTTPFVELELKDIEIVENDFDGASELVAVCKSPKKGKT